MQDIHTELRRCALGSGTTRVSLVEMGVVAGPGLQAKRARLSNAYQLLWKIGEEFSQPESPGTFTEMVTGLLVTSLCSSP